MGAISVKAINTLFQRLKSIKWTFKKIALLGIILIMIILILIPGGKDKNVNPVTAGIHTAFVDRGPIVQTIEGTGILQPSERFVFKAKTDGIVEQVFVTEGSQVKAGDLLLQISNEKVAAQIRQALLQWELEQKQLNKLLNPETNSAEVRSAQLKVEQYKIALAEKQEELDKLTIKAPYNGTILKYNLQVGQRVSVGQKAVQFATSDEVEVVAQFDEKDISSITAGMEVNVYVKGLNKTLKGKVKEVAFTGDTSSGKFEVIIELLELDESIRQGMQTYNTVIIANDPKQDIFLYKQGSGYIRYTQSDEIATEVSGTVAEIYHNSGVRVYKDEPLIRLSNPELERQLEEVRLQLENAEEALQQLLSPDEDTIKKQEMQVLQSYNSYLTVQEKLDSLSVISPIDGVVVSLFVSPGEELIGSEELVVISNFQQMEMEISVDELDINKLSIGQEATINVDALPDIELSGRIIGIAYEGITTNDITRYTVTLAVDYTEGLKGGMSATAIIVTAKKDNVLRVPSEAVTTKNGQSIIQVLADGRLQSRVIKTGLSTDRWTEITDGLQEGEEIVVVSTANRTNFMFGVEMNQMNQRPRGGEMAQPSRGR